MLVSPDDNKHYYRSLGLCYEEGANLVLTVSQGSRRYYLQSIIY